MLNELEILRKKVLKKLLIWFSLFLIAGLCLIILSQQIGVFIIIFGFVISLIINTKDINSFKRLYKEKIVLVALNQVCTDIEYDMNKGMNREIIANTNMMRMGDRFRSNDLIKGKYHNISFEMSDIIIEDESTDSDGNETYYKLFQGQWFIFDFNKRFKANFQIYSKNFTNVKRGSLFAKKEERFKKIELEDVEFNNLFKVYAQNQLDAFYVLTPNTMEKIKELNNKIKGKLLFCFIDNKLHIGLDNNQDFFEVSLFKKIDIDKSINKTNQEISIITNFVDILSLNNDLFI